MGVEGRPSKQVLDGPTAAEIQRKMAEQTASESLSDIESSDEDEAGKVPRKMDSLQELCCQTILGPDVCRCTDISSLLSKLNLPTRMQNLIIEYFFTRVVCPVECFEQPSTDEENGNSFCTLFEDWYEMYEEWALSGFSPYGHVLLD